MAPFPRTAPFSRQRLAGALAVGAAAVGLVLGGFGAGAAMAADAPTTAGVAASPVSAGASVGAGTAVASTGWVRLAHLSPDTKAVDIRLSALAGGSIVKSLSDIGYGAVSPYMALDPGTYVVAMAPTGAGFARPVIQASVTVVAGQPLTVAAYGKNADLQAAIYQDDLSTPSAGQARVRVVQASTIVPTVSVATSTGTSIASNVAQGSATAYGSVGSGPWTLDLTGGSVTSKVDVQLDPGSVSTLFVLDDASGGLALKAVLDSASAGDLPAGGIQTGGGGTAAEHRAAATAPTGRMLIDMVTGVVCVIAAGVGVFIHRRRTRPTPSTSVDLRVASRLARDDDVRAPGAVGGAGAAGAGVGDAGNAGAGGAHREHELAARASEWR